MDYWKYFRIVCYIVLAVVLLALLGTVQLGPDNNNSPTAPAAPSSDAGFRNLK
jgi:hypothetical protein